MYTYMFEYQNMCNAYIYIYAYPYHGCGHISIHLWLSCRPCVLRMWQSILAVGDGECLDNHHFCSRNHRKTIGKWWFNWSLW